MKPIAVFRHAATEGPGYFATFIERRGLPWRLIAIDQGAAVPQSCTDFAGLVFMGGPMSVNDDLPWIAPVLDLIRDAVAAGVPVLGHCLGGQLIAKALGAAVTRNAVKEIGWGEVRATEHPLARQWLGDVAAFPAFHWHGETFAIPAGATRILASDHCANQAYVLGPHLGMQCHVEMTETMIRSWCEVGAAEVAEAGGPAVQSPAAMLAQAPAELPRMRAVADRLYGRWLEGVRP
jgi:GMP synthase-like glutamine amidotransferase